MLDNHIAPSNKTAIAAVDLGTNNCRMLIASADSNNFSVIDSFSRITRLGEGLTVSRRLSSEAMERTIDALKICASKMKRHRVKLSRNVTTEACRRAENCNEFVEKVKKETGIFLEIISPHEEAKLALSGCSTLIDPNLKYTIVFDIGGGSTEVIFVSSEGQGRFRINDFISMPFGVVTVSEDCGGGDLSNKSYQEILGKVKSTLLEFDQKNDISKRISSKQIQMIGVSGTVTTLGGLNLNLAKYDRKLVDGYKLVFNDIKRHTLNLRKMDLAKRASLPCIGWQRADLLLGGCAILEGICELWPVGYLRIADRGLREGILNGLLEKINS